MSSPSSVSKRRPIKKTPTPSPPVLETIAETPVAEVPPTPTPTVAVAEQTIVITNGLASSDKNCRAVPISQVTEQLLKSANYYERTQPTEIEPTRTNNRVYVDLDGKMALDTQEDEFNEIVESITGTLVDIAEEGEDYSIQQSCKWRTNVGNGVYENKLSFSLVYKHKHGDKRSIAMFVRNKIVPVLRDRLEDYIPLRVCEAGEKNKKGNTYLYIGSLLVDMSVYNEGGRKMRLPYATKPNEDRPKTLVRGSLLDSLITYIPEDSVPIPPPAQAVETNDLYYEEEQQEPEYTQETNTVTTNTMTTMDHLDIPDDPDKSRELVRRVIAKLGQHRFDYYPNWIRLGFALFNEGFTLEEFIEISKRSCKWVEATSAEWITDKWKAFNKSRITSAMLWRWLSEDDADAYDLLSKERTDFWLLIKNNSHAESARFFFNLRPDAYTFHNSLGWYVLQPNKTWKLTEDMKTPSDLLMDIWNTFKTVARHHLGTICEGGSLKDTEDPDEAKLLKAKLKAINSFVKQCGTAGFADGMIKYLPSNYYDMDLPKKMDGNQNLIAFTDKVLNVETMEVRDISAEDYISITTCYNYPAKPDQSITDEVMKMLWTIFENDDMVRAFLEALASCLYGYNRYERFYILTGKGGNGKGLVTDLMKRVLGDYFFTIPSSIITKANDKKDSANPHLAKCKGRRMILAEEPEATDKIQVGLVKDMTGGGEMVARELYKNPIHFIMMAVLFINTNGIPMANKIDGGYKRRTKVVRFPHNFVATPTLPHHRLIDYTLKDIKIKSNGWRDAMLYIIMDAHKRLRSNGSLFEPKAMLDATEEYLDDNTPVKGWLLSNFTLGLPEHDRRFWLGSDELRTQYCDNKHTKMSAETFKHNMEQCEIRQEKASHPFTEVRWDKHQRQWISTDCGAGKYWVGLMPIGARHPDDTQTPRVSNALFIDNDMDISGVNTLLMSTMTHLSR